MKLDRVQLQEAPFDPGAMVNAFVSGTDGAGAAVTFTGIVRSGPDEALSSLTIEHYPELAVPAITAIVEDAVVRFALIDVVVIHRFGVLAVGEPIMQVMTMAPHRADAFQAAEFLMDYLKTDAPFWKKETAAGETRWVASKQEDELARARWSENPAR